MMKKYYDMWAKLFDYLDGEPDDGDRFFGTPEYYELMKVAKKNGFDYEKVEELQRMQFERP